METVHKENTNTQTNLTDNDFFEYFKKLSSEIAEHTPDEVVQFMQNNENREGDPTFPCLDEAITKDEIQTAIKRLNTNKSSGFDNIINE